MSRHLKIMRLHERRQDLLWMRRKAKSQGRACDDAESLFVIGIIGFVFWRRLHSFAAGFPI